MKRLIHRWKLYWQTSERSLGFTLIELMVSISIGSLVLLMLMQMVVMNVSGRRRFEYENVMQDQSYFISERIRQSVFELQPHSIELITNDSSQTVIHITHEYDITIGIGNILERDYSNPVTDILIYDKLNEELTYNGTLLHSSNIHIQAGSSLSIIEIDPVTCASEPSNDVCDDGILRLELIIAIELPSGALLDPQTFVSTIIV